MFILWNSTRQFLDIDLCLYFRFFVVFKQPKIHVCRHLLLLLFRIYSTFSIEYFQYEHFSPVPPYPKDYLNLAPKIWEPSNLVPRVSRLTALPEALGQSISQYPNFGYLPEVDATFRYTPYISYNMRYVQYFFCFFRCINVSWQILYQFISIYTRYIQNYSKYASWKETFSKSHRGFSMEVGRIYFKDNIEFVTSFYFRFGCCMLNGSET